MTRGEKKKETFDHFTDDQLHAEFKRLQRLANETQSTVAKMLTELRRRYRSRQKAQNAVECGGGR